MKKNVVLLALCAVALTLNAGYASAAEQKAPVNKPAVMETKPVSPETMRKMTPEQMKELREKRTEEFNKALNLSETQIEQAKQVRMAGREKMKPVMENIKIKRKALYNLRQNTKLSQNEKEKKMTALQEELRELETQARRLRIENQYEFEAILTDEQKSKFEEIKSEGRRHYKEYRKPMAPEYFHHSPHYEHH